MATFSVAVFVRESAEVLQRFVSFYERIGAERIQLFYDGTSEEFAANGLEAVTGRGLEFTCLDQAFWAGHGSTRPDLPMARQRFVFPQALATLDSDWLFLPDADEFVIGAVPLGDALDRVPDDVDSVSIAPAEAIWGPDEDPNTPYGSTWFRRPDLGHPLRTILTSARLYGRLAPLFRSGILSHTLGKHAVRRGATFQQIGVHHARRGGQIITVPGARIDPCFTKVELAHFDAIGFARWRMKFARVAEQPLAERSKPRLRQIKRFIQVRDTAPDRLEALFRALYAMDAAQLHLLERQGLVFQDKVF